VPLPLAALFLGLLSADAKESVSNVKHQAFIKTTPFKAPTYAASPSEQQTPFDLASSSCPAFCLRQNRQQTLLTTERLFTTERCKERLPSGLHTPCLAHYSYQNSPCWSCKNSAWLSLPSCALNCFCSVQLSTALFTRASSFSSSSKSMSFLSLQLLKLSRLTGKNKVTCGDWTQLKI